MTGPERRHETEPACRTCGGSARPPERLEVMRVLGLWAVAASNFFRGLVG